MKKFRSKAVKAVLFFSFFAVYLNPAKAQKNDFYVNFDCDFSNFAVTMPDNFRNIPKHKDNGGGPTGLISQSQFEFIGIISTSFGPNFNFNKFSALHIGIMIGTGNAKAERNYTNDPGNGAGFTFAGISIQGPATLLGIKPFVPLFFVTPEISFDFPVNKKNYYPRISIDASYQLLIASNGWERYDSHEYKDRFEYNEIRILAHVIPIGISYKMGFGDPNKPSFLGVGLKYFLNFQTEDGREFGTNIFPIGISLSVGI
jgi:hypothetical protein